METVNVKRGEWSDGISDLMEAAMDADQEGVRNLIGAGADVNLRDYKGRTALTWAIRGRDKWQEMDEQESGRRWDCVNDLIWSGADVNAQENDGRTALERAYWRAEPDLIKLLGESGADVNVQDSDGRTALMRAANNRTYPDLVKALIKDGADVNVQDNWGDTALMMAAVSADPELIKLFVEAGADLEARTKDGVSVVDVLHNASWAKRVEDTQACFEIIQTAKAAQRAAALDRQLAQACDSWTPPTVSAKQTTRASKMDTDKQSQAQQEMPVPRTRQRF